MSSLSYSEGSLLLTANARSSFGANIMLGLFESGAQNTKDHNGHARLMLLIPQNFGMISYHIDLC